MNKRRWGQWILLAVVCLSFSIGESYAQKNDFANLRRYSKENAALPQATKKDKRVIFMGNSITEGWVRTCLLYTSDAADEEDSENLERHAKD